MGAEAWGGGRNREHLFPRCTVYLGDDKLILEMNSGNGCTMNVLNVNESYTSKWFKWHVSFYVCFAPQHTKRGVGFKVI